MLNPSGILHMWAVVVGCPTKTKFLAHCRDHFTWMSFATRLHLKSELLTPYVFDYIGCQKLAHYKDHP